MADGVQLGSAHGVIEIDASGVRQGVQQAEQSLSGFSRQFGAIGAALTLGVSAPLIAVGKNALDTAMDYESSMAMFQAVSGATADQMKAVSQTAIDLGKDMTLPATSAGDAGQAMTELAKAGLTVDQAMAAAKGTLQLAAAGQLDEAAAAQITAGVLNTFSLAGSEAGRVADMLAAGANVSSASVQDLAAGTQQAGFAFQAVGRPADELITSIAALTNVGLTGSDAGTALKNAFVKLAAPTKEGAALMQQLGINVFDAHGKMLPVPGVIDAFNKGLAGMSDQQRLAALNTIVLSDGAKALLPLLGLGAQGFAELEGKVTAQGAASKLAEAQMAGAKGALQGLGSQVETVGLTIAARFLPVISDLIRKVSDIVASFLNIPAPVQNAILAFLGVLAAAGPVALAIAGISAVLGALLSPIGLVVLAVAGLAAAFAGNFLGIRTTLTSLKDKVAEILKQVRGFIEGHSTEIQTIISTAWGFISGFIQRQITFITSVIQAGLALLRGDWDGAWGFLGEALQAKFGGIIDFITGGTGRIKTAFDGLRPVFDTFVGIIQNVWSVVTTLVGAIIGSLTESAGAVRTNLAGAWQSAVGVVTSVLGALASIVNSVLGAVRNFVASHSTEIQAFFAGTWTRISSIVSGAAQLLERVVGGALQNIAGFFATHQGLIEGALDALWTAFTKVVDVVTGVVDGFLKLPAPVQDVILAIAGLAVVAGPTVSAVKTVSSTLSDAMVYARLFGGALKDLPALLGVLVQGTGAWSTLSGVAASLSSAFTAVSAVVAPALTAVGAALAPLLPIILAVAAAAVALYLAWKNNFLGFRDLVNEIGAAIGAVFEFIKTVVTGFWQFLTGQISWDEYSATVSNAFAGMRDKVGEAWENIKRIVAEAWETIKTTVSQAATNVGQWLATAWENIKTAASTAWANVKTAISQKITEILTAVLTWLDDTLVKIENFDLKAAAEHFFGTVLPGIAAKIGEAIQNVGQWLSDVFERIRSFDLKGAAEAFFGTVLPGIAAKVSTALQNVGQWLSDTASKISGFDLKAAAMTVFQTVISGIGEKVGAALTNIGTFLSDAAEKIRSYSFKSHTLQALQTVVAGILEKAADILQSVGAFLSDISTKISSFDLGEAGRNLIQGLIGGIQSMAGALADKARGVVQGAIDAAKNLLGIHSPSRVFAEIGEQTMAGFAQGIEDSEAGSIGALSRHIQAVVNELQRLADNVLAPAAVWSAKALTDALKAVFENVGAIVAGLTAVGGYEDSNILLPLWQIGYWINETVNAISYWAGLIKGEAAASAKQLAESVGPVVEMVGNAVETLGEIGSYVDKDIMLPLWQISYWIGQIINAIAYWATQIDADMQTAAKAFAESAKPVVELVGAGIEALGSLAEWEGAPEVTDLLPAMKQLADFLMQLNLAIASVTQFVVKEMQEAARDFATNAKPVVDIVKAGLEAITELAAWEGVPGVMLLQPKMDQLADFLAQLNVALVRVTEYVNTEMQEAARDFATSAKPIVDIVAGALEALAQLAGWEGIPNVMELVPKMTQLGGFLGQLTIRLAEVTTYVGEDMQTAAATFAKNAADVLSGLQDALKKLEEIGELEAPEIGLAWVTQLVKAMTEAIPSLEDVLSRILKLFTDFQPQGGPAGSNFMSTLARGVSDMVSAVQDALNAALKPFTLFAPDGFKAGKTFMQTLAAGLEAGLAYVESALEALGDLFPHSPAKAGPLRRTPDWEAWMLNGMDQAAGLVARALGTLALPGTAVGAAGAGGGGTTVNVNLGGPVTIREEADLTRLAEMIGGELANQAYLRRRVNAAW